MKGICKMNLTIIIERDGTMWVARWSDFINLQESPAGFGDNPWEALAALTLVTGMR
jgi:hypothetical protein